MYHRIKNHLRRIKNNLTAQKRISGFEEIERAERIFYLNFLRDGMTVFDVGANVGELVLLFSRCVGESGKIHAFEAAGSTFDRLKIVCEATEKRNVALNHLALSDKKGVIKLNVYEEAYSSFNTQAARPLKDYGLDLEPVAVEETDAATVDDYCEENRIENIDLLKIDVEGAELQVMKGARKMLEAKRIKCLTFEFGQTTFDMGNRPAEIENFLAEMNYKIRNLIENEPLFPGREAVETAKYSMHIAAPS